MALDVVIWPWVPISRSQVPPTASRTVFTNRSLCSSASRESCRGSNAENGPTGSNLTAVKPMATYSAARAAARSGSL